MPVVVGTDMERAGVMDPRLPRVLRYVQRAFEPLQAQALRLAGMELAGEELEESRTGHQPPPPLQAATRVSSAKQQSRDSPCASPLPQSYGRAPPEAVTRSVVVTYSTQAMTLDLAVVGGAFSCSDTVAAAAAMNLYDRLALRSLLWLAAATIKAVQAFVDGN